MRRETKGGEQEGGEGTRLYILRKLGLTSSIFGLISISLMCTSDDRKSRGVEIARAPRGEKNCARKSGAVERITLINWARTTYLLTLY